MESELAVKEHLVSERISTLCTGKVLPRFRAGRGQFRGVRDINLKAKDRIWP